METLFPQGQVQQRAVEVAMDTLVAPPDRVSERTKGQKEIPAALEQANVQSISEAHVLERASR